MKKVIFTLTMIAVLAIVNLQNANAFSGGSGNSVNDPYLISNVSELEQVRSIATEGKFFKMTADITLSGDWTPIGEWGDEGATGAFQGHFDGGGYTISGLQITGRDNSGLFGWVKNSTIKNLTVHTGGTAISYGGNFNGILAGAAGHGSYNGNSTFENCVVSGEVYGYAFCGGLLGIASGSTLINCRAENVYVQSTMWNTGGLVSNLSGESTTITNCHVKNATIGSLEHNGLGGIVATIESLSTSTVTGCTVTGLSFVGHSAGEGAGGLAAYVNQAIISDCTVTDISLASQDFARQGGLIGLVLNTTTIDSCHVSGITGYNLGGECGGFIGLIESYVLINNCSVTNAELEGRGTTAGFVATRNGCGTISNCWVYGTIKTIPGIGYAELLGGFVGGNTGGVIRNCLFVGNVIQGELAEWFISTRVGGFVGASIVNTDMYAFEDCAAIANVSAPWAVNWWVDTGVGGFIGLKIQSGDTETGGMSNCFFSGTVNAAGKVGGFAGTLKAGSKINNCYAHAAITAAGNEKIGGFAGHRLEDGPAITDSYFIGSINQTGNEVGTFCGKNDDDNAISGCAQTITGINLVGEGLHSLVSVAEADLKTLSKYTGLTGYVCQDGLTFPYLSGQSAPVVVSKANPSKVSGTLFNTAGKVKALFDFSLLTSVSPASTSWEIELSGLNLGDTISVLAFENEKIVSYPVSTLIEEASAINNVDNDNDFVVSVRYFNLQGIEIAQPVNNNIYIVKSLLQSGKEKADKILFRQ